MRQSHRLAIVLMIALQTAACRHWQPRLEGASDVLSDPDVSYVRITRTDNQTVEARVAGVRGDTIYGTVGGSGPLSCVEAGDMCNFRLPVSQVGFLETREFSAVRTLALAALPVGVFAVVFLVDECKPVEEVCD